MGVAFFRQLQHSFVGRGKQISATESAFRIRGPQKMFKHAWADCVFATEFTDTDTEGTYDSKTL